MASSFLEDPPLSWKSLTEYYMKQGEGSGGVRAREVTAVSERWLEASDQYFSAPELHMLKRVVTKANLMSSWAWRANSKKKVCNQLPPVP